MEKQSIEKTEKEILKKLHEIQDLYYKAYPNGNYMSLAFYKSSIMFNNRHWEDDESYPIDVFEDLGEDKWLPLYQ